MTTAERVAAALGSSVVGARPATGGYSSAERLVIELADGRSVFAKCGQEELIAALLHIEHRGLPVAADGLQRRGLSPSSRSRPRCSSSRT